MAGWALQLALRAAKFAGGRLLRLFVLFACTIVESLIFCRCCQETTGRGGVVGGDGVSFAMVLVELGESRYWSSGIHAKEEYVRMYIWRCLPRYGFPFSLYFSIHSILSDRCSCCSSEQLPRSGYYDIALLIPYFDLELASRSIRRALKKQLKFKDMFFLCEILSS